MLLLLLLALAAHAATIPNTGGIYDRPCVVEDGVDVPYVQ